MANLDSALTTPPATAGMKLADNYDIVVAGGGLVGASFACAMAESGKRVAIVETTPLQSDAQASFDERTVALTYSSKLIFQALSVWTQEVEQQACPIHAIHVSNKGHFGLSTLSCNEADTDALGHVLPTRVLGQALIKRIEACPQLTYLCPAQVVATELSAQGRNVEITIDGKSQILQCQLLVVADGGRSNVLDSLAISRSEVAYSQSAVLSIVATDRPHNHLAYERFVKNGPLALLPLTQQRYAVVWTVDGNEKSQLIALDDADFCARLQVEFGDRAGRFSRASTRKSYPLIQSTLNSSIGARAAVIGNAAHTVHPVAGQGFNLGLRDAAVLASLVSAVENVGSDALLNHYQSLRQRETKRVSLFTDGMIKTFSSQFAPVVFARNLGLSLIDHLPFAKRFLLRRTMGLATDVSQTLTSNTAAIVTKQQSAVSTGHQSTVSLHD